MKNWSEQLAQIGAPLNSQEDIGEGERAYLFSQGLLGQELLGLLQLKNGFVAFESALYVRSLATVAGSYSLLEWNRKDLWRSRFKADLGDALFFAEDLFGNQFCLKSGSVNSFDPETSEFKEVAKSIQEWCAMILTKGDFWTGFSLGHEWQVKNGQLRLGVRLLPKVPFVGGGLFSVDNLIATPELRAMHFRAEIANQILSAPDGAKIRFEII